MSQSVLQLLTAAIRERHCVALRYRDQQQIRVVEPHAIYVDERGDTVVDALQIRGYSAGGRVTPFWRPFRIKKITALSMLKETFVPRTAEGFMWTRLRYNNAIALVERDSLLHRAGSEEMGPFLPKSPYGS